MAHRILGIDLGAYSVKVIACNPGFRHAQVAELIERPVPAGDDPHEVRAARVLGEIFREYKFEPDFPYAAVAGDNVFIHVLEFGFKNLRRPEMEKAVGGELEGILPIDLEDMVYGFDTLPGDAASEPVHTEGPIVALDSPLAPDDDEATAVQGVPAARVVRGRVAAPTTGTRVLACAMERARARQLLSLYDDHAVEPRGLVAAPASYARVAERIAGVDERGHDGPPIAVIDIGHERTDVCVVTGHRAVYARTIRRGGRSLTDTISRVWRISYEEAEKAKHTDGFIASRARPAETEQWERIHEVVVKEIGPMASDLKRTLSSCRAKTGVHVGRAVLVGGGSRLRGLAAYLSEALHIPVQTLTEADRAALLGPKLAETGAPADVACLAAGVAFEGASGRPSFDLRQGELAYKGDMSFLRAKATQIAVAALVIVAFAAGNAWAALYKLRKAEKKLDVRVALESQELFGEQLTPSAIGERIQIHTKPQSPLPKMTTYDMLLLFNSKLPDKKEVKLDVQDITIDRQGKIELKATAQSNAEIDKIYDSLSKVECFEDISRGNTSRGPNDTRQFSFTIKTNCM